MVEAGVGKGEVVPDEETSPLHSGHLNRTGWPGSGSIQVRSLLGQTAAQEVPR